MSLAATPRPFTAITPPSSTANLTPHRRLSRKRIPSPPRALIDSTAFEGSRAPLHTYPSTSSLADLYASHGRITPLRRSPVGSRCSSRGGAKLGFDGGDELQMFTAVIPGSHANISLPPTPPSGSGGEGDDDDGGVPLSMGLDGLYLAAPKKRRVLRRVKANINNVSPPPPSITQSAASDSTTTLSRPTTPPVQQMAMVLHHPRPLSKSPKSAYFEDSLLTAKPKSLGEEEEEEEEGEEEEEEQEQEVNRYYGGHDPREDILIAYEGEPASLSYEKEEELFGEEHFEVKRAESIKLTKAESIKLRRAEELEIKKAEEHIVTKKEEEQHQVNGEGLLIEFDTEQVPVETHQEIVPVKFTPEIDDAENVSVAETEPEPQPELEQMTLPATTYVPEEDEIFEPKEPTPVMSPAHEPTIFDDESDFETAAEGTDVDSDGEPMVLPSTTYVPEEILPATTYAPSQDEGEGEDEGGNGNGHPQQSTRSLAPFPSPAPSPAISLVPSSVAKDNSGNDDEDDAEGLYPHPATGKSRRKPTPWPTPRVNSFSSSIMTERIDSASPVLSDDGDLVFHDAPSSPLTSPNNSPRDEKPIISILASSANPPPKPKFTLTFGSAPSRDGPSIPPETPQKPAVPPIFNIIPATPAPLMTPTAALEKQLGDHSASFLQRRQTGDTLTPAATSPTAQVSLPPSARSKKAQRPSLLSQPRRVRESKLHPWWRPRPECCAEDEGLSRTLSAGSDLSVACAGTGSVMEGREGRGRRVTRRIKGTKFQIEFIGLGTLRDKVRVAGEKTSGLGRRISLRRKQQTI